MRASIIDALADLVIRLNNEETRAEYTMGMIKNIKDEKSRKPVCEFLDQVKHAVSPRG